MSTTAKLHQVPLQEIFTAQRTRLLGLCAYLTGDASCAEDLVQEVMLEAWRSFDKLRNPDAVEAWLNGISRNVCARWHRKHGRESAMMFVGERPETEQESVLTSLADDFDLEVELDRQEMALLLDRAMALLPDTTRDVLVGKYIAESRHAEIAAELGLTENAVTVRLHRGKVALRKLLTTELRADAETFGLLSSADEWTETRIWCPLCGQRQMMGISNESEFALRCPTCSDAFKTNLLGIDWTRMERPARLPKSYRPMMKRIVAELHTRYTTALTQGQYVCPTCQSESPVHCHFPESAPPSMRHLRGVHIFCAACNEISWTSLSMIALSSPEGLRFYQEHARVHSLPEQEIEFNGAPALVVSATSVADSARLDVIVHRDTFVTLSQNQTDAK